MFFFFVIFVHRQVIPSAGLEETDADGEPVLRVPLGGQGKIYGVVAVPDTCPTLYSHCRLDAGGCNVTAELCLPSASHGRVCV